MNKDEFERFLVHEADINKIEISNSMVSKLYLYMKNLIEWNKKINLTAIKEEKDIIVKHFLDSIFINKFIDEKQILDIGSGAGFPGIPLKISNEELKVTLIDSINKKVKFMQDSIQKLKLNDIEALHTRAEDLAYDKKYREKFDIVISRAVSNMSTLVEYMLPFARVGGKCLCLKGPNSEEEINDSKNAVKKLGGQIKEVFKYKINENDRCLVIISKEKNTEQTYPRKQGKALKEPLT